MGGWMASLTKDRFVRLLMIGWILIILPGCAYLRNTQQTTTTYLVTAEPAEPVPAQQIQATQPPPTIPPPTQIPPTQQQPQPQAIYAVQSMAMLPQAITDLDELGSATHYLIDLQVDYDAKAFEGRARVDYTNSEKLSLDRLYFRLLPNGQKSYGNGSLQVNSVTVNGDLVEPRYSNSDTVMELPLAVPVAISESLLIEMDFAGKVPVEFGGEGESEGYGIYNYSQGVLSLSGWYPILAVYDQDGWNLDPVSIIGDSVYSDTAFYTVDVTTDKNLRLAATGEEIEQEELGNDTRTRFASGPVRDFFLIMSPDFQVTTQDVDGVKVNSYYLPEHAEGGQAALDVTSRSLEIYNQRFGEYPFAELDVVEAPMRYALGVEFPSIFLVASELYAEPAQDSFIVATAHEVAHQWWYSVVGNDVFDEPWLDESLATYSSSLYYQEALGQAAYRSFTNYWNERLSSLRQDGLDDQVTQSLGYFEALENSRVYGTVVYTKGALFLGALREEIGDEAFFDALQNYYQRYKYQIAETDDLLAEFELSAGRQLDEFYQDWLYTAQE